MGHTGCDGPSTAPMAATVVVTAAPEASTAATATAPAVSAATAVGPVTGVGVGLRRTSPGLASPGAPARGNLLLLAAA